MSTEVVWPTVYCCQVHIQGMSGVFYCRNVLCVIHARDSRQATDQYSINVMKLPQSQRDFCEPVNNKFVPQVIRCSLSQ